MSRLPTVGGDAGNWGDVLNDYLSQSHKPDGTLRLDIANIADLKAHDVTQIRDKMQALVAGYYTAGDGGGGQFYYDAGANDADNRGTIIAPDAGTGKWKRIYSGAVNVKWFGAKGDGFADDSTSIQTAINVCPTVFFAKGTYRVTIGLNLDAHEDIQLIGCGGIISPDPPTWPLSSTFSVFSMTDEAFTVAFNSIIIDGTVAGDHYDDKYAMQAITVRSRSVTITNCRIHNFYGSGIVAVAGTVNIRGNYLYKCSGYNLTADSGARDNYGDGISCFPSMTATVPVIGGSITGNHIYTDPVSHRGRGGIVLDNPNLASGKINMGVNIRGNYIHGYDRGIHIENSPYSVVDGNYVDGAQATVLVSSSQHVVIRSNHLIADSTTDADPNPNPSYKCGLLLYNTTCHGTIIDGNVIKGLTSAAATIRWSSDIRFINNDVTGDVSFTGGGYNPGHIIRGNTFSRRSDLTDAGRLWFDASAGLIKHAIVEGNRFTNVYLDTTWQDGLIVRDNYFDFTTRDFWVFGATFSFNITIDHNIILLGDSATSPVFSISGCRGTFGRCNGNMVLTNATVNLFTNNSLETHNFFNVTQPNYLIRSNRDCLQMTFSSGFGNGDIGAFGRTIAAASGAIPSGNYVKGSIVYNTSVAAGGTAAQICTTAGYYAPAWVSSTAYRPGKYVTNDGGKVYICIATGTSAGSGGPTGTSSSISDNSVTWSYVAASATAVFKTLMSASA